LPWFGEGIESLDVLFSHVTCEGVYHMSLLQQLQLGFIIIQSNRQPKISVLFQLITLFVDGALSIFFDTYATNLFSAVIVPSSSSEHSFVS
jgi:hypothetical protein